MLTVQLGQVLQLQDGGYVLVRTDGISFRLRSQSTGTYIDLHITELALRLEGSMEHRDPDVAASPGDVDRASPEAFKAARELADDLDAVIHGIPEKAKGWTRELDAATTKRSQRLAHMAQQRQTSTRRLYRKLKDYENAGVAGILDRRPFRTDAPWLRLDERVREALVTVTNRRTRQSTTTQVKLLEEVEEEVLHRFPGQQVPLPSRSTLRRYLLMLSKGKYPTGNARNRQTAGNSPNYVFNSRPAIAPGHEVQIDTTKFTILVLGPDGKPVRVHLVIMVDKATRSILAHTFRLHGVKGFDLSFLLAECMVPPRLRPGNRHVFTDYELPEMPWAACLDPEEVELCETRRPFIKPQRIMTDNGPEYRSETYESACRKLGIDITRAAPGTPTDKAMIERVFHSIDTLFAQHVPGYVGSGVEHRGQDLASDKDWLTVYELQELFDRWVTVVWQNRSHKALRDPLDASKIHSPNSMYMAMYPMTGCYPMPLHAADYIELLPVQYRSIQRNGVTIDYRRYDSPELVPFRLLPSGDELHNNDWEVRYNPHDPSVVWVRGPGDIGWIECPWMNSDLFIKPFSRSIRREARRVLAEFGVLGDKEAERRTIEIIAATTTAKRRHQAALDRAAAARRLMEEAGTPVPKPTSRQDETQPETALVHDKDSYPEYEDLKTFDPRDDEGDWG